MVGHQAAGRLTGKQRLAEREQRQRKNQAVNTVNRMTPTMAGRRFSRSGAARRTGAETFGAGWADGSRSLIIGPVDSARSDAEIGRAAGGPRGD